MLYDTHLQSCYSLIKNISQDKFRLSIMWLRDTGILERVILDFMSQGPPTQDPRVRHNQPLILRQLGIIMIVMVVGLFIATIVFLVELPRKQKLNKATEVKDASEDIALNIALYFAVSEEKINQYYCLKVRYPSLL